MWQEARKQEKKLRGMMVDHKRRAERRREYYEKIKLDPTQFLQVHGRPCKIHLDPAVSAAADAPTTMMPWQGNKEISIDRFDVRAHLDFIVECHEVLQDPENEPSRDNRETNYERYRILVQNDFLRVPEEKFLRTIELEEKYGSTTYQSQKAKDDKKKSEKSKAAIGFVYTDSTAETASSSAARPVPDRFKSAPGGPQFPDPRAKGNEEDGDDESDSDIDLDMTVDIMALGHSSQKEINKVGKDYNLGKEDFIKFLARDIEEQQELRDARQKEEEKAMFSGRKSRRERRIIRERRLLARKISPPSYATRSSPSYEDYRKSSRSNSSRSATPENNGKVEFITSFGGDSEEESATKKSSVVSTEASKTRPRKRPRRVDKPAVVVGPTLPNPTLRRSSSSERKRQRRRRRSSSRSYGARCRRSSGRHSSRSPRGRQRSRSRRSRSRSRTREKRRPRSKSGQRSNGGGRPARPVRSDSDSSSSDSSKGGNEDPNRYRSKYRNRRRSSSSSSKSDSDKSLLAKKEVGPEKEVHIIASPEAPVKRYYDRIREHVKSDAESDLTDEEDGIDANLEKKYPDDSFTEAKDYQSTNRVPQQDSSSSTVKDKIRKRMQAQIKRQFKIDKLAEEERRRKQEEERLFREEEMRELALKLRKKERDRRHLNHGSNSSGDENPGAVRDQDELQQNRASPPSETTPAAEATGSTSDRRESRRRRSRSHSRSRRSPKRKRRSRSKEHRRQEEASLPARPRLVDY